MSTGFESRRELVRELFYLITAHAEDAATLAVEGQAPNIEGLAATELTGRLRGMAGSIVTLSDAIDSIVAATI